jgi:hypothetical protein
MAKTRRQSSQSGNILIYILGAIVLFGLVTVILRSNYQPGTGIDDESTMMKVSQVRRYAAELERGVAYAMNNGASETELRFAHSKALAAYGTYGTTPTAEIFHPSGGGVEWRDPPSGIQTLAAPWVFTAANTVKQVGSQCTDATCTDLVAILPNVTKAACIQFNLSIGTPNPNGAPPKETGTFRLNTLFNGSYTYNQNIDVTGEHLTRQPEGCFEGAHASDANLGLTGRYFYYKTLLVR